MLTEKRLLNRRQFLAILPTVSMAIVDKLAPRQNSNRYNPKFNIGDYVECVFDSDDISGWYERGEIIGMSIDSDGEWSYDFIIQESSEPRFLGQFNQVYEVDLILLSSAKR